MNDSRRDIGDEGERSLDADLEVDETAVSGDQWRLAAGIWNESVAWPAGAVEDAVAAVLERLRAETRSHTAFALAGIRLVDDADDPLRGWRPGPLFQHGYTAPQKAFVASWRKRQSNFVHDPLTQAVVRAAGRPRVVVFSDVLGGTSQDTPSGLLLERLGASDRIIAACPLEADLEVFYGMNRQLGDPPYGTEDQAFLLAAVSGLPELSRRFAMSHGIFQTSRPLPPRQREVLLHLLTGDSEKEIAARLGLSPHWLHQVVVAVYRRFGVRSRPQLMALWLSPTTRASED